MLVWYEVHATMESAIAREKAIKGWKRACKMALIVKSNRLGRDLYEELGGLDPGFRRNDEGDGLPFTPGGSGVPSLVSPSPGLSSNQ